MDGFFYSFEEWIKGGNAVILIVVIHGWKAAGSMAKILGAHPNRMYRELIGRHLRAEGHVVYLAADGAEVLAALEEHSPDLAMIDLDMENEHGWEICRRVRHHPRGSGIPVLVTGVGTPDPSLMQRFSISGFIDRMHHDGRHMVEAIEQCLAHAQAPCNGVALVAL